MKVVDTSLRFLGFKHPGALVPYIAEVNFSTIIVGNSSLSTFHLGISDLSLFLIDDLTAAFEHLQGISSDLASPDTVWKVRPMFSQKFRTDG